MIKILGIAASLRNARFGGGSASLVDELRGCADEAALDAFLAQQAKVHLRQFVEAGREEGLPFDAIQKNLRALRGDRGLSNSEVALGAALWSAIQEGCDVDHLSLAEYFPATGVERRIDELKERLLAADGILLATPVYFGDRGSLAQTLIDLIRDDGELRQALSTKTYAGIAVGAKRNGGQETTLIYQLFDMLRLGLWGVGNDSETTSQYGGTGMAGDVGTMAADSYGLDTSKGTGRRIAQVAQILRAGHDASLRGPARVAFWVLQDRDDVALDFVNGIVDRFGSDLEALVVPVSDEHIARCIACDICPTHVGPDEEYRCIIRGGKRDQMSRFHDLHLGHDAIVPVVYSPTDRSGIRTNYQQFIERTRYLRRGDYVFSNLLTAPLVLEDLGALENMHMRMSTSMMRHHTVLSEPMVGYLVDGQVVNEHSVNTAFTRLLDRAKTLSAGRLARSVESEDALGGKYNPVGYVLSVEKDNEDQLLNARSGMIEKRRDRLVEDARLRLADE